MPRVAELANVSSGTAPYDYAVARDFMTHLDTLLDESTRSQLHALGFDLEFRVAVPPL